MVNQGYFQLPMGHLYNAICGREPNYGPAKGGSGNTGQGRTEVCLKFPSLVRGDLKRVSRREKLQEIRGFATSSAVTSDRGIASGQRMYKSVTVRYYWNSDELDRGPTSQMCV
jgi:hypothetical protein